MNHIELLNDVLLHDQTLVFRAFRVPNAMPFLSNSLFLLQQRRIPLLQHLILTLLRHTHHFHDLVILPRVSELLSKLRRVFNDSLPHRLVVLRLTTPSLTPNRIHKAVRQLVQSLRTPVSLIHSRHSVDVRVQMAVQIRRHALSVDRFQLLAVEVVVFRGVEAIFKHAFDAQTVAVRHAVLAVVASEHDAVFRLKRKERERLSTWNA